jgi:hypothetical protein
MTIPKGRVAIRGIGRPMYHNCMPQAADSRSKCVMPMVFDAWTSQGPMLAFNALSLPRQGL